MNINETISETDTLVVVDFQNDFAHVDGTLYVKGAETVIPVVNLWYEIFNQMGGNIIFTRDWHPSDHCSFTSNGGIWPAHCEKGTWGAQIHEDIDTPSAEVPGPFGGLKNVLTIRKGLIPNKEEYSAFSSGELQDTLLDSMDTPSTRIFICGLATDYCVFHTVMDGLKAGFDVYLIRQGIKGVDFNEHKEGLHDVPTTDSEIAIGRMVLAGAKVI